MRKVVQVVQNLSPGGIEVMALELKRTQGRDNVVKIVSLEGNRADAIARWPRLIEIEEDLIFMGKNPGWDLALLHRLVEKFRHLSPDVVHTHHIGPLIYGGLAAKWAGVENIIHTEHDAWHLDSQKRCFLERVVLNLVKPTLIADAEIVAKKMKEKLKRKKVRVIKNGIDVKHFSPGNSECSRASLGLPLKVKLVGTAGRLEAVKGQSYLLKAMKYLPENVHLAVAGVGSLESSLKNLARECGVDKRVWFLGGVDDMPVFYQSLDVFCLPSIQEGLPLSVLEAQACGVPSVVTNVGGASESLCKNSGILTRSQSVEGIVRGIKRLINSKETSDPRVFVQNEGNIELMSKAYTDLVLPNDEVA